MTNPNMNAVQIVKKTKGSGKKSLITRRATLTYRIKKTPG